jgi:DNA topoisomerase-1
MNFTDKNPEILLIRGKYKNKRTNKIVSSKSNDKIKKLGIPPAYKRMWVSKNNKSNIQIVAEDKTGKKQYFYHKNWINDQSDKKYKKMYKFMIKLPLFLRTISKDSKYINLSSKNYSKFSKKRVMANMFKIMKITHIRIGNKKYTGTGLSTMKKENLKLNKGNLINFTFKGKSGVNHSIKFKDKNLFDFLKEIKNVQNDWLFVHSSGESCYRVDSTDMNKYLQSVMGEEFTCKDFRTYAANQIFLKYLMSIEINKTTQTHLNKNISIALEKTAKKMGHNKSTSKNSYIDNKIIDEYLKDPFKIKKGKVENILIKIFK